MKIPFLDLRTQYLELKAEIDEAALLALDSGWYILGKRCEKFELDFKEYLVGGREGYVVGVNSGTDALKLSLLAAGVEKGNEVITVANTAIPTVTAICSTGAIPVFCDVNPETWLMEPELIESCITGKTRAIIPVHLYGAACDMAPILSIAEKYRLMVIEDVAQATGAEYGENKCGTIADFGAFSFYPSKNLGACGDGGAIFVRSSDKKDVLTRLRNYGQGTRYRADLQHGENSRLDEIQAAILSVKLRHLKEWNGKRRELAHYYRDRLNKTGLPVHTQKEYKDTLSANHLFAIKSTTVIRDRLMERMQKKGIQTLIHYPHPLYRQPAFAVHEREVNPVSEDLCASILSLPFHQYLSYAEIDYVVKSLAESLAE
jgi:dTDP-4-amino-4,6-dideoxygalactose transaminase